jgi:ATP-binding cassette subfamily B protein
LTADLACALIVATLALVLPMCVRYITGEVIVSGSSDITAELLRMGAVMVAIIAAQTGFSIFYDYKGHDMGAKIERDMRLELYERYQALPFSFYDDNQVGSLMSRLVNDLYNMAEMCHHSPENLMIYGTQFAGSLVFLFIINWELTAVICAVIAAMAVYSIPFYKIEMAANKESRERISDVNALTEESLSGIRVIKGFAAEEAAVKKFAFANERFYMSRSRLYKNESLNYQVVETFFKPLITVAIIVFGGAQVAHLRHVV